MRLRSALALALCLLPASSFAQTAGGPAATTPPEGAGGQGSVPPPSAATAEAPAAPEAPKAYDDTADTRGEAMRAYQKALDAKKLAASSALSIQRLREDLPGAVQVIERAEHAAVPAQALDRMKTAVAEAESLRFRRIAVWVAVAVAAAALIGLVVFRQRRRELRPASA